ncbi:protein 5NUC-like isoform X3 [Drosophila bipectinata]|uniref:protein 5NUC-like isoform X3 n=1 Tax=Drosophila bipectinata TaxID=42026 RepID=UPI0038B27740
MWKLIIVVAFVTFLAVGGWCENFSFIKYHAIEKRQTQFEFIILHTNDMHARFEQTNFRSGTCSKEDAKKNKCCGGFARVAYQVRKHRKEAESGGLPVIFLNGGDTYTGTAWFTLFKHEIVTAFMNKLAPEAASLGNHEFDRNIVGLVPYLNGASFPILACNLDPKGEPDVASSKLGKSTILTVKDVKVGVIGFITPDTGFLASKNKLVFNDEISSIKVSKLLLLWVILATKRIRKLPDDAPTWMWLLVVIRTLIWMPVSRWRMRAIVTRKRSGVPTPPLWSGIMDKGCQWCRLMLLPNTLAN